MIIAITSSTLTPARRRDIRGWYKANGLSTADVLQPIWVDTDSQAIKVNKIVAAVGQGDADFPEIQTDEENQPITTEHIIPMHVDPPEWLT
jgi:hypothetical protein